jgi:flagellar biosynthesis/type III secretory pathway protein FliH
MEEIQVLADYLSSQHNLPSVTIYVKSKSEYDFQKGYNVKRITKLKKHSLYIKREFAIIAGFRGLVNSLKYELLTLWINEQKDTEESSKFRQKAREIGFFPELNNVIQLDFSSASNKTYEQGLKEGYAKANKETKEVEQALDKYEAEVKAWEKNEMDPMIERISKERYDHGYNKGKDKGYQEGYNKGFNEGYDFAIQEQSERQDEYEYDYYPLKNRY